MEASGTSPLKRKSLDTARQESGDEYGGSTLVSLATSHTDDRVLPIPGPRWLPGSIFAVIFPLLWYGFTLSWLINLIEHGSGYFVRGSGFVPGSAPPAASWILWSFFAVIPVGSLRAFAWNLFGWEMISLGVDRMMIERKVLHISLYPREKYDRSKISHFRPTDLDAKRSQWVYNPRNTGALAFDYDGRRVVFGASLAVDHDVRDAVVAELAAWSDSS